MSAIKILVVDDEASLRMTLAANLELEGFEVVEAESAEHALRILGSEPFDLVLSDIRMPGRSGIELVSELRRAGVDLPVVLMTAFTEEKNLDEATRNGVFTVLTKPFRMDHGIMLLLRALRRPTVLVVDDAHTVAMTTASALTGLGLRVEAVNSGMSALDTIRRGTYDVCIVDLVMPEMNGIELIRRLHDEVPGIAVIVYSGSEDGESMMAMAASEGAFRCLRKPLDPLHLASAIAAARGAA
jgi:DNA-binding NtrC family response regulator